jgi:molybdopterin-biosynthesis enzyme MoeA-like protein
MSSSSRPTAALLLIGNELLSGKIQEANQKPLAELLFRRGILLRRVVTVGDVPEDIQLATLELKQTHTYLFTSGGVGPTHDDITIEVIAKALGTPVVTHPVLEELIRGRYKERTTESHLRMAMVPRGAVLEGSNGAVIETADASEWPAVRADNVWIFPGVPEAFRMKLGILAEYLKRHGVGHAMHSRAVLTQIEESAIVDRLNEVVAQFPNVSIGSYPKWFDPNHRTKVTFDAEDESLVQAAADALIRLLGPDARIQS